MYVLPLAMPYYIPIVKRFRANRKSRKSTLVINGLVKALLQLYTTIMVIKIMI